MGRESLGLRPGLILTLQLPEPPPFPAMLTVLSADKILRVAEVVLTAFLAQPMPQSGLRGRLRGSSEAMRIRASTLAGLEAPTCILVPVRAVRL